ncbi:hypothetical protein OG320_19730 [Microbispora sp. NBC_01189]|uniref:hypothetical protein n=1 Tax=Microbispora sp. NBC_01189 TaxID=2903583 RepID=UPI002E0DBE25|nr:hypothetical protein OG320_19730 [Microbispora sp. NBC_01189]
MSLVRQYCRAYHLADLRRFPGWAARAHPEEAGLPSDTVVYLWDDLSVVADPVAPDGLVLWDADGATGVDGAWARFCREELNFETPED